MPFDYEQFLAALDAFQVPPHPLPGPDVRLPRWSSKPLPPYNGFSGEQRIAMWQRQKWAQNAGLYPTMNRCTLCGRASSRVILHSENYAELWNAIPLCGGCHMAVHGRFKEPARWAGKLARHTCGNGRALFNLLPLTPIDVAGWLRDRNVPSFLWPH